ncbi:MAG: YdjY domain-containing protein, partial [Pirellulales bacterium]
MSGRLAKLVSGGALAALLPLLLCAGCNNNSAPPNEGVRVPAAKPPVAAVDEHTAATGETPDKPVPPATTAKPGDDSDSSHTADEMPDEDNDSATDEESPADSDSDADTPPAEAFVPESLAVAEKDLLVDAAGLTRLDPDSNVWVDKENKRVVLAGEVCRRDAILEMFACIKGTKEHEAVVSVHCKAFLVHTGLLAVGAEPGHPVRFQPEYEAAEGPEIEITVLWKDEEGEVRQARAQDWIRNRS